MALMGQHCRHLSTRWKESSIKDSIKRFLAWLLAVLIVWPWRLDAQSTGAMFRPEEIE
jgi:hypothetical protein